ncbi:1222_t:CDS:1, partial [Dentiscutata heterogama]
QNLLIKSAEVIIIDSDSDKENLESDNELQRYLWKTKEKWCVSDSSINLEQ